MDQETIDQLTENLTAGELAVIPTDTVYGIVTKAQNENAVNKLIEIRGREAGKPFIVLISSLTDLKLFDVNLTSDQEKILSELWPGPFSVELSIKGFDYLKNGTNHFAFRLPQSDLLQSLLKKTGPLVAPSANPPSQPVATTIDQAKKYFGDQVKNYLDGGELISQASTVIALNGTDIEIKRQGLGIVPEHLLNPLIEFDHLAKVKLKIGKILSAERVEKSDKLLKLQIDLGESTPRQIIAGIGLAYKPESLIGLQVAIVANLKPRKLMGLESQGMILAASNDNGPVVLNPEQAVENGCDIH